MASPFLLLAYNNAKSEIFHPCRRQQPPFPLARRGRSRARRQVSVAEMVTLPSGRRIGFVSPPGVCASAPQDYQRQPTRSISVSPATAVLTHGFDAFLHTRLLIRRCENVKTENGCLNRSFLRVKMHEMPIQCQYFLFLRFWSEIMLFSPVKKALQLSFITMTTSVPLPVFLASSP